MSYAQSSIKRIEQVKTLASLQKGVHVGDETVYVSPYVLFSRLIINVERSEDMKSHLEFELSPAPPALFMDSKMRKANKASLIPLLTKDLYSIDHIEAEATILDRGALLHRLRWRLPSIYGEIISQYVSYLCERYGRSTIVFDQYTQRPSTKDQEHDRRKGKTSPNVHVTLSMTAHGAQQDFLTNEHNKNQLIVLLMEALESDGHCVKQAEDDADTLIVSSALDLAVNICPVVVVADDIDVFVMMIYHFSSDMHDIYFFSEPAARSKKAMRYISVRDVQQKIGCDLARRIIFLHG